MFAVGAAPPPPITNLSLPTRAGNGTTQVDSIREGVKKTVKKRSG